MESSYSYLFNPLESLDRDLYGKHKLNRYEELARVQHLIEVKSFERAIFLINKKMETIDSGLPETEPDYKKSLLFNKYRAYRKLLEGKRVEIDGEEIRWRGKLFYEDLIQIGLGKPKNKCLRELNSNKHIFKIFFSLAGKEELGIYSNSCHLKTFIRENRVQLEKSTDYYRINESSQLYLVRFDDLDGNKDIGPELICRELKPLLGEFINTPRHDIPIWLVLPLLGKDILYEGKQKVMGRKILESVIDLILFNESRGLNRNIKIIIDTEDETESLMFTNFLSEIKKEFTSDFSLLHEMFYFGVDGEKTKLFQSSHSAKEQMAVKENWDEEILGFKSKNPSVRRSAQIIGRNLLNDNPILLLGKTGVGKTFIAKRIAELRKNAGETGKFVHLNCAGLPSTLIESEIFGYEKGSHGLADSSKDGKIAAAEGGILFLDEIGNASIDLQQKLLTFLDDKRYYPLGAIAPKEAKVKIIFATNKNIEEEVSRGRILEDFYYRISKLKIRIPSLQERKDDLVEIITGAVKEICNNKGLPIYEIDKMVLKKLIDFPWPGNYRQLMFLLEQYVEEASEANLDIISEQVYNRNPPELLAVSLDTSLKSLESALTKLLFLWPQITEELERKISKEEKDNTKNPFNLIDAFIKPVLRNIYSDNEERIKKELASNRNISKLIGFVPTDQNEAFDRYRKIYTVLQRTIK